MPLFDRIRIAGRVCFPLLSLVLAWIGLGGQARAQVAVTDSLAVSGSADVFLRHADDETYLMLSQYQVEVDYAHKTSGLYSHVELEGRGGDVFMNDATDKNQFRLEAAFLGYHFDFGLDLQVGRFISPSGYEGAEPWRRFTRITAFGGIFAYLQNGVALKYKSDAIDAGGNELVFHGYGAFIDGAWSGDTDLEDGSFEALVGVDFGQLFIRIDYAYERVDNDDPELVNQDRSLLNIWAQYTIGPFAVAAEYNRMSEISGVENGLWHGDVFLAFAKLSFTKNWALGARFR